MADSAFRFGKLKSNVVVNGTKNGVNNTFTTPDYYTTNTLLVFLNGFMYQPTSISQNTDHQTFTINADNIPKATDVLTATYVDYIPNISFPNLEGYNSNLIHAYSFEESSLNIPDRAGSQDINGNYNSVTLGASGKSGNSPEFQTTYQTQHYLYRNGTSNTDHLVNNIDKFTISFWVYFDVLPSDTFPEYGIFFDDESYIIEAASPSQAQCWIGKVDPPTFPVTLNFAVNGDSHVFSTSSAAFSSTGVWYHVVLLYDSVNNVAKAWVDNSQVISTSGSYSKINNASSGSGTYGFSFGHATGPVTYAYFEHGKIDEFYVWDDALSTDAITELYNSGTGAFWNGSGWS